MLLLLYIAVYCQLFLSYKASMATGNICLPAWRPDCSRRLAASYMQLSAIIRRRGTFEEKKRDLLVKTGYGIVVKAKRYYQSFLPGYNTFPLILAWVRKMLSTTVNPMCSSVLVLKLTFSFKLQSASEVRYHLKWV